MASQADVETALATVIANALYPAGTASPSAVGATCRVYRGVPVAPALDADMALGVVHVSVLGAAGGVKNVTRYPRAWVSVAPVAAVLNVVVSGVDATFAGACAAGQLAGVIADEATYAYAVQGNDSPATVASNMAALLRVDGWIVDYQQAMITVPAARRLVARVVAGAGALQEIKRQRQSFRITLWCPDPARRDEVVPVVDQALAALSFLPLADGSSGRVLFQDMVAVDAAADARLYRQDLNYEVEYPTTLSMMTPAMLFGTENFTADAVLVETLQS
jgi:hypothetical protein